MLRAEVPVNPRICPACAEFRTSEVGGTCPTCNAVLLAVSEPHLEVLVRARLRKRVEDWRTQGLLTPGIAARLMASLGMSSSPSSGACARSRPGLETAGR